MKKINLLFSLTLAAALSACAYHPTPVSLQPVGPSPQAEVGTGENGYLMVYSELSRDPSSNRHSRYTISAADGSMKREIPNHRDVYDMGPTPITLAPGTYNVVARCAHTGHVMVPVEIKKGVTTYVYLDGTDHLESSTAGTNTVVKLPNGTIAGWAATK